MTQRKVSARAARFSPWLVLAHDLGLAGLTMAAVLVVRYHFERKPLPRGLVEGVTLIFVLICAGVFLWYRQNRTMWRFTTLNDVMRLARAVIAANLLLLPVLFIANRAQDFPRSTLGIVAIVLTAARRLDEYWPTPWRTAIWAPPSASLIAPSRPR